MPAEKLDPYIVNIHGLLICLLCCAHLLKETQRSRPPHTQESCQNPDTLRTLFLYGITIRAARRFWF